MMGSRGRVRDRVGIMVGIGIRVRVWNRVSAEERVSVRAGDRQGWGWGLWSG